MSGSAMTRVAAWLALFGCVLLPAGLLVAGAIGEVAMRRAFAVGMVAWFALAASALHADRRAARHDAGGPPPPD